MATILSRKSQGTGGGGGGAPSGPAGGDLTGTYPNPTIAANAVDSAEIAANAVGASELADNAVDTAAIANGAVTAAKVAADVATQAELDAVAAGAQPLDQTLTALSAANWAANSVPIGTGADTLSQTAFAANTFPARSSAGNIAAKTITDFGLSLVDDVDAAAGRTTLGAAPSDPSFITTAAEAGLSNEKVLGTTVIASGTRAARPAAAVAGYLYYATDERQMYRDTGAAWVALGVQPSFVAMPPTGAISETLPRWAANSNNGPLNSGRLSLVPIWLPGDRTITSITFVSGTTAAGTPTNQLFGLFDDAAGSSGGSGYALLRASNNDTTTAWAADSAKTLNLTSTYVTLRSGWFNLGIMVAASTAPTLTGAAGGGSKTGAILLAPVYGGSSTTGLTTTLPDPAAAPTATNAGIVYAYVS